MGNKTKKHAVEKANQVLNQLVNGASPEKSVRRYIMDNTVYKEFESNQATDPNTTVSSAFSFSGSKFDLVTPAYSPEVLKLIPEENNILSQCIDVYVQNIENTGHTLDYIGPEGAEEDPIVLAEKSRAESLVDSPNPEYSLAELRRRVRYDKETFGYAFIEITRDTNGEVMFAYHVPAHVVKMTKKDREPVDVIAKIKRNGVIVDHPTKRYFRRFVQQVGNQNYFFKEYGDPRNIDYRTGDVIPQNAEAPLDKLATEIVMISRYKSGFPYGLPRWTCQLPSILGSRESEMVNLEFFRDNAIPALAVLVGGGGLTQDSLDTLVNILTSRRGRESMNRVAILEAVADSEAASIDGKLPIPAISMQSLTNDRQSDALFQNYDNKCQEKIRSAFRLPPILLGLSSDYTRATAVASLLMCESQVFQPERAEMDELINRYILGNGYNGPQYWVYKSNPSKISDKQDIAENIDVFEKVGALTPNVAIGLANELFGLQIQDIQEPWGNYPFSMTQALIAKDRTIMGLNDLIVDPPESDTNSTPPQRDDPTDDIPQPEDMNNELVKD